MHLDQHLNLDNPLVHILIQGVMDTLRKKQQWAEIFAKKMKEIQEINDQFEAASRDEVNWIDDEEPEENPFILEDRKISERDLELLLEITIKMN